MSSLNELAIGGRPLSTLRVVDLKEELEKFGLSKSGTKKDLYERLKVHLLSLQRREGVQNDDEQLPNISMQEKLAEDNPFLREYFSSQAELFHSQKLVKKQYQEEKKRESEASADEAGGDSPVKSRGFKSADEAGDSPVKPIGVKLADEAGGSPVKLVESKPVEARRSPAKLAEPKPVEARGSPVKLIEYKPVDEAGDSPVKLRESKPVDEAGDNPAKLTELKSVDEDKADGAQPAKEKVEPEPTKVVEPDKSEEEVKPAEVTSVVVELDLRVDAKERLEPEPLAVKSSETLLSSEVKEGAEDELDIAVDAKETLEPEPEPTSIVESVTSSVKSRDSKLVAEEELDFGEDREKVEPESTTSSDSSKSSESGKSRQVSPIGEELDFGEDVKEKSESEPPSVLTLEEKPKTSERVQITFSDSAVDIGIGLRKIRVKSKGARKGPRQGWPWKSSEPLYNPSWSYIKENFYQNLKPFEDEDVKFEADDGTPLDEDHLQEHKKYQFHDFKITRTISNEFADNGNGIEEDPELDEAKLRANVEKSLKRTNSVPVQIPMDEPEDQRELSPSRNPPSQFIIITNLVRPFTLTQLKELLQRTGNVAEFWVDKIKSKCIAKFENEDEALETRAALHGVKWPPSNSKPLRVDFTTGDTLEKATAKDLMEEKLKVEENSSTNISLLKREWDLGKRGQSRERNERRRSASRNQEPDRKRPRTRSPGRTDERRGSQSYSKEHPSRNHVNDKDKKDNATTGKALDELFRKTVATPCIYWLPLTAEQISEKEENRRKRMRERDLQIAEMRQQHLQHSRFR